MKQSINRINNSEKIPIMKKGKINSYRAEDIKRWGIQRFLETVCSKEPIPMPDFMFTDEENKMMDKILSEEKISHDL